MRNVLLVSLCLVVVASAGCSEVSVPPTDAGPDTGPRDAALADAAADAGPEDAGIEDAGIADAGIADAGIDVDAAPDVDAGPLPLFESVDDRSVPLVQRLPCPPALAFDPDGSPLVAISDATTLRVMQLVAGAWTQLGADVNAAGTSITAQQCPALVVASDGSRYIAFQQYTGAAYQARVRRLEGASWVDEVAFEALGLAANDLDMALGASGEPVVAFVEPNPGTFAYSVTVRRRVGGTFVQEGGFGSLGVARVRIAVRPDDTVVALVTHSTGFSTGVGLIELSAGAWTARADVDAVGDTTQSLDLGDVHVDDTRAWVTWVHATSAGTRTAHLSRFEGGSYTALDLTPVTAVNPELAVRTGAELTWVYSTDNHLQLVPHDGTSFGVPADGPMVVYYGHLAWNRGQLYLAYTTSFGGGSANAELVRVNLP